MVSTDLVEPLRAARTRGRCVTGIEGLDDILGGGIPKGNLVLVAGTVGTGKTTLTLEYLVRGAERGERSLFLSMTESSEKLVQNLSSFEFFQPRLLEEGSLVLVDVPMIYHKLGLSPDEMSAEEVELLVRSIGTSSSRWAPSGSSSTP
jgi:circadian clock protein KaiC